MASLHAMGAKHALAPVLQKSLSWRPADTLGGNRQAFSTFEKELCQKVTTKEASSAREGL